MNIRHEQKFCLRILRFSKEWFPPQFWGFNACPPTSLAKASQEKCSYTFPSAPGSGSIHFPILPSPGHTYPQGLILRWREGFCWQMIKQWCSFKVACDDVMARKHIASLMWVSIPSWKGNASTKSLLPYWDLLLLMVKNLCFVSLAGHAWKGRIKSTIRRNQTPASLIPAVEPFFAPPQ